MTSTVRITSIAVAMTAACDAFGPQYCEGDWAAAPPEAAPPTARARTVAQVLPVESSAIDVLFVIDDSRSMTDEQAQLGVWSRELFDVLARPSGELPDLHVAVTSSSVAIPHLEPCASGRGGSFHIGEAVLERGPFLRDVATASGRERNYSGTLAETFATMAKVGSGGCGFEQPFKAARLALTAAGPNKFLRDDALLLVVFVTDEDDCSARSATLFDDQPADACSELGTNTSYRCFEHGVRCYDGKGSRELGDRRSCEPDEHSRYVESVSDFAGFLKRLKPNPAQVVVAGIYGKPNLVTTIPDTRITSHLTPRLADVCGGRGEEGTGATPAIRMNALMAEFGGRASHSSICESQLAWAMRGAGLVTRDAATRSRCLRGVLADADVATAGLQPACRVEAVRDLGTAWETRTEVPPCDGATGARCFTIGVDARCETETQLAFSVAEHQPDETLTIACDVDREADRLPDPPGAIE